MSREDEAQKLERKLRKARRTARIAFPIVDTLAWTWKKRWIGVEHFYDDAGFNRPGILTVWHHTLLAGSWIGRDRGFGVLISQHGDGELITKVMQRLGFEAIRGSSTRGGARALIQLLRVPKEMTLVMTPDGPRGPSRSVQDGVLFLADRGRRLILPTGLAASRTWRAKSWDRLLIPKPFASVVLYTLPAIEIPSGVMKDEAETERWRRIVGEKLNEAERRAQAIVDGEDERVVAESASGSHVEPLPEGNTE